MDSDNIKNIGFLPYTIYKNLAKFLEYRQLDLVAGAIYADTKKDTKKIEKFLEESEMITKMQYYGYILIEANDKPSKDRRIKLSVNKNRPVKTYILLIERNSAHLKTSQNFVKLLNRIPGFSETKTDHNMDVIIITHNILSVYSDKKVKLYTFEGDENKGFIHIHSYKYVNFTSERPKHKLVAKHRIISRDEENEILKTLHTDKINLPKILLSDPMSVWLGVEVGDIIEAQMPSEATGIEIKYLVGRPG